MKRWLLLFIVAFCHCHVVYAQLAEESSLVSRITFSGNYAFTERDLRKLFPIQEGERFTEEDLAQATFRITNSYKEEGFYLAKVTYSVSPDFFSHGAQTIAFEIEEGEITRLDTQLAVVPKELEEFQDTLLGFFEDRTASREDIQKIRQDILYFLRTHSYLAATVEIDEVDFDKNTNQLLVELYFELREPFEIVFEGNEAVGAEDLLALLDLRKRTIPISPSALSTLRAEIISLYQRKGYYFVDVDYQNVSSAEDRRKYQVSIQEKNVYSLDAVSFSGNEKISTDVLRALIQTQTSWPSVLRVFSKSYLTDDAIEADIQTIRQYYYEQGFRDTEVHHKVVTIDQNSLGLELFINEGREVTIASTHTHIENVFPEVSQMRQGWSERVFPNLRDRERLSYEQLKGEQRRIAEELRDMGFPQSQVVVEATEEGEVTFAITTGPEISFGTMTLSGNLATKDEVVMRELRFATGELYSESKLLESKRNLFRTGLFSFVSIEAADGAFDSGIEDVVIKVVERPSAKLELGLGYDTEDGLHVAASNVQKNLYGTGNLFQLGLDGFIDSGEKFLDAGTLRGVYRINRFADGSIDLLNEAYGQFSVKLFDEYSYDRFGYSISLEPKTRENFLLKTGLHVYREDLFDVREDVSLGEHDEGKTFYSVLNAHLSYDQLDNRFNPSKGYALRFGAELSHDVLGSEVDLYSVSSEAAHYAKVFDFLVWSNTVRGEFARTFDDSDIVPLSRRFFLGGRSSLRGFSRNSVGPRGLLGNVVGGDTAFVYSSEFQWSVTENIILVPFIDIGRVTLEEEAAFDEVVIDSHDIRYTPGLGFRYKTPIGPVSIDYGFVLNRKEEENRGKLNFSIGGTF